MMDVFDFIKVVFPKFKFCLISNSFTKLDTPVNTDIVTGDFRSLDISAAPFFLSGCYVLEFPSAHWERIRTFLYFSENIRL